MLGLHALARKIVKSSFFVHISGVTDDFTLETEEILVGSCGSLGYVELTKYHRQVGLLLAA